MKALAVGLLACWSCILARSENRIPPATCAAAPGDSEGCATAAQGEVLLQRGGQHGRQRRTTRVVESEAAPLNKSKNVAARKKFARKFPRGNPVSATKGVFVADDLEVPTIPDGVTATIKLREAALGWDDEWIQYLAGVMDQYHSGLHFELSDGTEFVFELWDTAQGILSLVPEDYKKDGTPIWGDHNAIVWTPGFDKNYWAGLGQSSGNGMVLASGVSTDMLRKSMQYMIDWATNPFNRLYIPWTVWKSLDQSTRSAEKQNGLDRTCDSYVEDWYHWFAENGGKGFLNGDVYRPQRNYAAILSTTFNPASLDLVNANNPTVRAFYEKMREVGDVRGVYSALDDWDGPFFIPARVGDAAEYPTKYVRITDFKTGAGMIGQSVYADMALPSDFYGICRREQQSWCWWGWSGSWCHAKGSKCEKGKCVCNTCAFKGTWGKWCGE